MLRADNVICGTSSTGAGTLTLAACPGPPGGLDFDKWLKATGIGFVSTNAVLVSYTIIEYTDATFATAKQTEKGIGTLTLGASITAATLARTTVQSKVTGLDTSTPAPTFAAPTAITIGTAANTLIFVGASAADVLGFSPYNVDPAANPDGTTAGFGPLRVGVDNVAAFPLSNGFDYYIPFIWPRTMLVKRASVYVSTAYTGANSNIYGRLYQMGSNGRPGKLLYDFGSFGTLNSGLASTGIASTGAAGNGFFLTPGEYWFDLAAIWTAGGTGTPAIFGLSPGGYVQSGGLGTSLLRTESYAVATAAVAVAPDPAETTSYTPAGSSNPHPAFLMSAS